MVGRCEFLLQWSFFRWHVDFHGCKLEVGKILSKDYAKHPAKDLKHDPPQKIDLFFVGLSLRWWWWWRHWWWWWWWWCWWRRGRRPKVAEKMMTTPMMWIVSLSPLVTVKSSCSGWAKVLKRKTFWTLQTLTLRCYIRQWQLVLHNDGGKWDFKRFLEGFIKWDPFWGVW